MNRFRVIFVSALLAWLMLRSPAIAMPVTTITLKAQASVASDSVTLADVAEIDSPDAWPGPPSAIARGIVGHLAGDSLEIDAQAIRQWLLKQPGMNPAFWSLKGPARCRVTRVTETDAACLAMSPESSDGGQGDRDDSSLVKAIQAYFQMLTGWPVGELRATVVGLNRPSMAMAAGARVEFEPQASAFPGRCPLIVRVYEGSQLRQTLRLQVDVARSCQALVAVQTIARGQPVTADRVESKPVLLSVPGEPITDLSQIDGQISRTLIRPGVTLLAGHLQSPHLVRRGDWVTVRCLSGDLVVTITARAMSEATMDQVIEVRNESSRQSMSVRVVGPKQAVLTGTAVADQSDGNGDIHR